MRQLIINVPMDMRDRAMEIIDSCMDNDLIEGRTRQGILDVTKDTKPGGYLKFTVNENIVSVEWITITFTPRRSPE